MISLVEVTGGLQSLYSEYAVELMHLRSEYADSIGVKDNYCKNYSDREAVQHLTDSSYKHYIIFNEENSHIGILQIRFKNNRFDNLETHVCKLYIKDSERHKGYATEVVSYLKNKYSLITMKCWYGLPEGNFLTNAGFTKVSENYMVKNK